MRALLFVTLVMLATVAQAVVRLEPSNVMLAADVVAMGLQGPAGMAMDPLSGDLYVAERDGNRISCIRSKEVHVGLDHAFEIDTALPDWAVGMGRTEEFWTEARLRSPVDVSFDRNGVMYVAEAGIGGRLVRFDPGEVPFRTGQIVSTPWLHGDYAYTGIVIDRHDRMFLTARQSRKDTVLPSGSALVRDEEGAWWMMDYGPFSDFAAPVVDADGEFVVLCDRQGADICWYDYAGQVNIGVLEQLYGVRHIAVTQGGCTLATLEKADGSWSVIEVDPNAAVLREWIGGLTALGGMYIDPVSGAVYLSLAAEGKVLRLQRTDVVAAQNKLKLMRMNFLRERDLPPTRWPKFFRSFMEELAVIEPIDKRSEARDGVRRSLTLAEFTQAMPVIAGKAAATLLPDQGAVDDPIVDVSFAMFMPNQSMSRRGTLAPSISLFCVRHRSGVKRTTRFMPTRFGQDVQEDMAWEDAPMAFVSFPTGFEAQRSPLADSDMVRVYFLGMGLGPDYHIDLPRLFGGDGLLVVERRDESKVRYRLDPYPEDMEAGGTSVLVANNRIRTPGWYSVSDYPVIWNLVIDQPASLNLRHSFPMEDFLAQEVNLGLRLADSFERTSDREDLRWRRDIILQSAARWGDVHF